MKPKILRECINTPLAIVERQGDDVKITSTLAGTTTLVSLKQLQNWAVSQLRKELITPRVPEHSQT